MIFEKGRSTIKPKASDCLLIGDSITNYYDTNWDNLYTGTWQIDAYGIPGAQIDYIIDRIEDSTINIDNYSTIFILLGINNLADGDSRVATSAEMDQLLDLVKYRDTFIISLLPLDNTVKPLPANANVRAMNPYYQDKGNYINCYDALATGANGANPHTVDGIHLLQSGYDIIEPIIYSYIDFT